MEKVVSNTLVKNGQPFIGKVLEQVIPFVDRCVVTISMRSNDGTLDVIKNLSKKYPNRIDYAFEDVKSPGELTFSRQEMIYRSGNADWILFLDDDDYWPTQSLKSIMPLLNQKVPGFAVNPYQVVDKEGHDRSWRYKWFTKWFRNANINYRGLWPRDLVYTANTPLYWRQNEEVVKIPIKYYHLAMVKNYTFRDSPWAKEYKLPKTEEVKEYEKFDDKKDINEIFRSNPR